MALVQRCLMAAAACMLLVGCQPPQLREEPVARDFYSAMRAGDQARLNALMSSELAAAPATQAEIAAVRKTVPASAPRSIKTVGWHHFTQLGAGQTLTTLDEYDHGERMVRATTVLGRASDAEPWRVRSFNLHVATRQELAANDFSLAGKSVAHYSFLAAVLASPLLMIAALVKVVRRRGLRRKWLWGPLAFAGLFSFKMNWTTGQTAADWLTVQLIGAGVTRAPSLFEPWILTVTLPLGALLILAGVWANPARAKQA